jgi:putative ABC transport system permease protein
MWMRVATLTQSERRDGELSAEIESHLQMHIDDNLQRGMTAQEARRAALIALGGVEQTKERYRDGRGVRWLETLGQDVRFCARLLRKNPGFTATAVLTLALGIGATTAIFSLVDVVLFRPLPIAKASEVMRITSGHSKDVSEFEQVSFPDYLEYRDLTSVFSNMAACIDRLPVNFSSGVSGSDRVVSGMVTGSYFETLGVKAELGRTISDADDKEGAAPVAMISHDFWRRQFSSSINAVGSTAIIDGEQFTIVGVTPSGFGGVTFHNLPQVWLPATLGFQIDPLLRSQMPLNARSFGPFMAVARLKQGITIRAAQSALDSLAIRVGAGKPVPNEPGFVQSWPVLVPAEQEARQGWAKYSSMIIGTVLLVLLIACANASGLLLAHSEGRQKEIAVRAALGATRFRIIRLQLMQGLLVAILGSAVGCVLADGGVKILLSAAPATLPIPPERAVSILDTRVLAFAVLAALISGIVSSLGPAFRSSRVDLISTMKGEAPASNVGIRRVSLQGLFVTVQVSASVLLLVGAGLLGRTLWGIAHIPLGFDPAHILAASTDPIRQGYDKAAGEALLAPLLDSLRAQPGVQSAALGAGLPFDGGMYTYVTFEGRKPGKDEGNAMRLLRASPGYFSTLGIPLLRGRDFQSSDVPNAPGVAIINEAAALRHWPGEEAIGKHIGNVGPHDQTLEIVGVVGNVAVPSDGGFSARPTFYLPLAQGYLMFPWEPDINLIARGTGEPGALVPALREAIKRVNPALPVFHVQTMSEDVEQTFAQQRFLAQLLLIFAAVATVLCAAGIYAQAAYATAALTREFGIRMALGAQPREVFGRVLSRGAWLGGAGLAIGLGAALGLTRILTSMLYGVSPLDALTFAAVGVVSMAVVMAACFVPARRAMRVDPMVALRHE